MRLLAAAILGVVGDDIWASLADQFADEAYASVKGCVRTYVMHRQLLCRHLQGLCSTSVAGRGVSRFSWPKPVTT